MLNREQRLFVVVGFTGALGGLIHTARSLYEYAGNRILRRSWLPMYIFRICGHVGPRGLVLP